MNKRLAFILFAFVFGVSTTIIFDLITLFRTQVFSTSFPNYGLVGRWICHMADGQFFHESIKYSAPQSGERLIGWVAHYLIGLIYAVVFLITVDPKWRLYPKMLPAVIFGIATVLAPFLLMQPAMGAGVAASLTPDPMAARISSFINHACFGLSLYLAGQLLALWGPKTDHLHE
ncbi:MAG: DUF2938 domain-containing protein [Pseudomonadota bacterium]